MLSSHLGLGLPSGHLPSGFLTNNLYTLVFFPDHFVFLEQIILIIPGEEYK
jgi:hypothetical protein